MNQIAPVLAQICLMHPFVLSGIYTGNLRDSPNLFLKNSAYRSLQVFIAAKPLGATVLWTAKGAGKTYTLARVGHAANHRFVYIDWKDITGKDAKTMFYNQLEMNTHTNDKPFGTYLPDDQGIFTTFVFDHFDYAMIDPNKIFAQQPLSSVAH